MSIKPFAESCEQNKQVILSIIQEHFSNVERVLEIGSGTGQHAVYFATHLAHLHWITSDCQENHAGIQAWLDEAQLENVSGPIPLDVNQTEWSMLPVDGVFSANTVHIMDWPSVENMFSGIGSRLKYQGVFCLYGPFNYRRQFTSVSNAEFDQWLKQRDPKSGIRDFEKLNALAAAQEMNLIADHAMPANNRILVWQKARVIEL